MHTAVANTMLRILHILRCGFRLTCPACGYGRMFRSRWTMNLRCPVCGIIFERDAGEVTGGMWINATVTSTLGVFAALYFAFFTHISVVLLIGALAICTVAFGLLFYRHARGLWVSILYLTGSIDED
jgi:uncharacterized protein (DUF983 family)